MGLRDYRGGRVSLGARAEEDQLGEVLFRVVAHLLAEGVDPPPPGLDFCGGGASQKGKVEQKCLEKEWQTLVKLIRLEADHSQFDTRQTIVNLIRGRP